MLFSVRADPSEEQQRHAGRRTRTAELVDHDDFAQPDRGREFHGPSPGVHPERVRAVQRPGADRHGPGVPGQSAFVRDQRRVADHHPVGGPCGRAGVRDRHRRVPETKTKRGQTVGPFQR